MSLSQKNQLLLGAAFALQEHSSTNHIKIPASNNIQSTSNTRGAINDAKKVSIASGFG